MEGSVVEDKWWCGEQEDEDHDDEAVVFLLVFIKLEAAAMTLEDVKSIGLGLRAWRKGNEAFCISDMLLVLLLLFQRKLLLLGVISGSLFVKMFPKLPKVLFLLFSRLCASLAWFLLL